MFDRMAYMTAKTNFSKQEFTEILSNYQLGELKAFNAITEGTVQTNFLLQTTQDTIVFRYYENRTLGSVLFESNLIRYLKRKNYPCPAPIKNRKGKYVTSYNGKPYVVFEFVEGRHLENPNETQKNQLIQKAAELQNITRNYKPRNREHRWNYTIEFCRELAQKAAQKINTRNSKNKLEWFESELAKLHLPKSLPKGMCHCDFHFSNILFKDGDFKALLDFDDANYTFLTYDLINLMNPFILSFKWDTWFHFQPEEQVLDFKEARKTVAEYEKYRPLSSNEKRHLFDVYKLSIMVDCLWYFERGDVKNFYEKRKIEYLNSLGREKFYAELFATA